MIFKIKRKDRIHKITEIPSGYYVCSLFKYHYISNLMQAQFCQPLSKMSTPWLKIHVTGMQKVIQGIVCVNIISII